MSGLPEARDGAPTNAGAETNGETLVGVDAEVARAEAIFAALAAYYGAPAFVPGSDPVIELVGTILSANTNDTNSGRALDALLAEIDRGGAPDWSLVAEMPANQLKQLIRVAGMYNSKAPAIVGALAQIHAARGAFELDFLATLPVADAMAFLTSLPGVGHKTASIVLLFCFNRGAFPVDTHIQRITQRLGLARRRATPEKIKAIWEQLLPPETFYPLHLNLIRLGREVCEARVARCDICPLSAWCDYANVRAEWALEV